MAGAQVINEAKTTDFGDQTIKNVTEIQLKTIVSDDDTSVSLGLGEDVGDNFIVATDALVVLGETAKRGFVGAGTATPDRRLEVLDASDPQLRLTQADGSKFVDLETDSTGRLNVRSEVVESLVVRSSHNNSNIYIIGNDDDYDKNLTTGPSLVLGVNNSGAAGRLMMYGGTLGIGVSGSSDAITIDGSKNATFISNLSCDGNVTLGDAGADTHTLNGTLAWAQEVATPSAPSEDGGGIVYVKADGKLYYISDTVAETELSTAAGGGGLTVTGVAVDDSPVTGAVDTVYIVNSSGGNVTINLPAAVAGISGKTIDVLHETTGNDCIIDPNLSETINGSSTSITMNEVAYQNVTLICDGSEWFIR